MQIAARPFKVALQNCSAIESNAGGSAAVAARDSTFVIRINHIAAISKIFTPSMSQNSYSSTREFSVVHRCEIAGGISNFLLNQHVKSCGPPDTSPHFSMSTKVRVAAAYQQRR